MTKKETLDAQNKTKTKKSTTVIAEEITKEAKTKKKKAPVEYCPTGMTLFDLSHGGGMGVGKIINLIGEESSGKTLFALECIMGAKKHFGKKLKIRYNACEGGFSFDVKEMYGLDLLDEKKPPSSTVEEMDADLDREIRTLKSGETLLYVVDSLDGLSSSAEKARAVLDRKATENGEESKGTYGMEKQKFLSKFFRLRALELEEQRVIFIVISQVRYNVNAGIFESKFQRSGGKGLNFYAGGVFWLHPRQKQRQKKRVTGVTILCKNTKNKIGKPFRDFYTDCVFDYGVDTVRSNLIFLNDMRTDTGQMKKKGTYTFVDQEGSLENIIAYVEDQNLESELAQAVRDKWNAIEDSISSSHRKRRH